MRRLADGEPSKANTVVSKMSKENCMHVCMYDMPACTSCHDCTIVCELRTFPTAFTVSAFDPHLPLAT